MALFLFGQGERLQIAVDARTVIAMRLGGVGRFGERAPRSIELFEGNAGQTWEGLAGTWPAKESGPIVRPRRLWSFEVALKSENNKLKAENSLPAPTPE
jgi:hypothetical protein